MRACEARAITVEQAPHDLDRLSHPRDRRPPVQPQPVEPGSCRQAEIGATARREIQGRRLPCQFDRMQRRRIQRCRPETHALGGVRDQEQRKDRRLEEQVVVDRDHVEAARLRPLRERRVPVRPLV
jgi:hypothetical protein